MSGHLLLGNGTWHWQGWVTVDANPVNRPDYLCEFPPLPDDILARRWSEIVASHVIEHLFKWDALELLKACYTILEPNGVLTLEQPDILYCAKVLTGEIEPPQGRDREQFSMWGLYGAPNGNKWDGHHWGYTPATLTDLVVEAGFMRENVTISAGVYHESVRDFTLKAVK